METLTNKELIEVTATVEHLDAALASYKAGEPLCKTCLTARAINSALHSKGYSQDALILGPFGGRWRNSGIRLGPKLRELTVDFTCTPKADKIRRALPVTEEVCLYENSTLQ